MGFDLPKGMATAAILSLEAGQYLARCDWLALRNPVAQSERVVEFAGINIPIGSEFELIREGQ